MTRLALIAALATLTAAPAFAVKTGGYSDDNGPSHTGSTATEFAVQAIVLADGTLIVVD